MSNTIENINLYLYENRMVILGYIIFVAWWAVGAVALNAAGKMKYGIIPCIVNWIGWKLKLVQPSECLKWFQERPVYLVLHPVWIFCIAVAISLLTSLYENVFHIRKEVPLMLSICACSFIAALVFLSLKQIRRYDKLHNL